MSALQRKKKGLSAMKVKFFTDTEAKDIENKMNQALEEIGAAAHIRGISVSVTHPEKMRGEKIVGVGNLFSALIAYEE